MINIPKFEPEEIINLKALLDSTDFSKLQRAAQVAAWCREEWGHDKHCTDVCLCSLSAYIASSNGLVPANVNQEYIDAVWRKFDQAHGLLTFNVL